MIPRERQATIFANTARVERLVRSPLAEEGLCQLQRERSFADACGADEQERAGDAACRQSATKLLDDVVMSDDPLPTHARSPARDWNFIT
jgi:hypothetical protein